MMYHRCFCHYYEGILLFIRRALLGILTNLHKFNTKWRASNTFEAHSGGPQMYYGLTIWGHTSNANVMKIQRFQNRSARICTQYLNYDISNATRIHNLRWLNVLERREFLTGVLMYKCVTDHAPKYLSDLFTETRFVHNKNTRNVHNQYLCMYTLCTYKLLQKFSQCIWS